MPDAEPRRLRPLRVVSTMGALSTVAAGLVGAGTLIALGGPLVMGFAIWSGRTTEPVAPDVDYPLVVHGLCLLVAAAGWWLGRSRTGPLPEVLLHGGAVASFLTPVLAFVSLWRST